MKSDKTGRIVWHDLFTEDAHSSRSFYQKVACWGYVIEHSKDFAWGGGERNFILALSGDEAGAGFVEFDDLRYSGWIPYVEVSDVDSAAENAVNFGGSIEKPPFEVPGVGRNCLLRDPKGALLGICLSRHNFPTPTKQFGPEIYTARMGEFPADFYRSLFNWSISSSSCSVGEIRSIARANTLVGITMEPGDKNPSWIPSIRVGRLSEALDRVTEGKGSVVRKMGKMLNEEATALVVDQCGVSCCLLSG